MTTEQHHGRDVINESDLEDRADVVVIGSGLGGLTTAAYLAAAGKQVIVLEHHDLAGGNSQVFRRGDLEFDVGVHYLGQCEPGGTIPNVLAGVGVADRIRFRELDPEGFDTLVFPEFTFRVPRGYDEYRENFARQFPEDLEAFDTYLELMRRLAREWPSLLLGGETPTVDEYQDVTLGALFDRLGLSASARTVLAHLAGTYGSGPAEASVLVHALLVTHYAEGAYYPEGGGQVLAARLVEVIEAFGGEVRTLTRVRRIEIDSTDHGPVVRGVRVVGVHADDECERLIAAPVVVSNADLRRTLLELVGAAHLSASTVATAESATMSLGLVCTYVVVDRDLSEVIPNSNYLVFDTDDLDAVFGPLERGERPEELPFAYLSFASLKDPENRRLCAPGQTNFQIMTLAPRGSGAFGLDDGPTHGTRYRRDPAYRELKNWYTERLLDKAEAVVGPLRDHLVHVETATPLSQERYTLSTEGTSYGLAHTPAQSGRRRPSLRTEIGGLFLVGSNTMALHGIAGAMVGGVMCAGEVLDRPLLAEVMLGQPLVEPADLPPFDPEADPIDICRGAALRERRGLG